MSLPALPLFVKLAGRPVILIGEGEAAEAKRRLLERAGAKIVGIEDRASLAVVAVDDPERIVTALRERGVLVNTVDRPELCDFTVPAIVDRSPVLVAIGTAGVSAGLAAALRQKLEVLLPARLGRLAEALHAARGAMRARWPDGAERRRALGAAFAGQLDPLLEGSEDAVGPWLARAAAPSRALIRIRLRSGDPDDLTLREARFLAGADRLFHRPDVPDAILDRARADAVRIPCDAPPTESGEGMSVDLEMAG
ncbi:precorrin-2 dehydrogenase/sirohydrochlorin ferrochelatase family protein [Sphingomonas xinjiangensis]|uniref:precorrin-2 dehydrogenase n=1 Tax=Sphingomonas xinjiangensis TaxID=643568 RepID=A0A840YJP0_9SPHN|nr:bifunctional precorrin-2 dehydrogenase/sirohydrochlorin ferrochelatase [Sphingomonas xinjiangensis]MBB5711238.1 uroporphyrin-III C-methyltransferase/precorrin-2 dehydrogenase/sirohydrochlorin ferrochelatase [Sphingomonas xinjiangensis]